MRRFVLCGILLAAMLVFAAPAQAAVGDKNVSGQARLEGIAQAEAAAASAAQASARPRLGLIDTGPLSLSGTVLTYGGAGVEANVEWGLWEDSLTGSSDALGWPYPFHDYTYGNSTDAAVDGTFTFSGVTEQTDGSLFASYTDANGKYGYYATWGNAFSAPGPLDFTLQPGHVNIKLYKDPNTGYWSGFKNAQVVTFSSYGSAQTSVGLGGYANAMPDNLNEVDVYFWDNQGYAVKRGVSPIAPGVTGESLTFHQVNAKRFMILKPYWASGKPGTVVTVGLQHWQVGEQAKFYGSAESPSGAGSKRFSVTKNISSYSKIATTTVTVPTTATPGYVYDIDAYTPNASMLDLTNYFQVCTLKPSKAAIAKGSSVRLSGVVPIAGHWGSTPGTRSKDVILYKRTTTPTGAPTYWDATDNHWTKVAKLTANRYGKFTSGYQRPSRTTWYVLRYPGDAWYWGAFTSITKVTVR